MQCWCLRRRHDFLSSIELLSLLLPLKMLGPLCCSFDMNKSARSRIWSKHCRYLRVSKLGAPRGIYLQPGRKLLMSTSARSSDPLFVEFLGLAKRLFKAESYQRVPNQGVPALVMFVRFRYAGQGSPGSSYLVKFNQREDGHRACNAFVIEHTDPIEVHANFPGESPNTYQSSSFAGENKILNSRWLRYKRQFGLWWHNLISG